MRFARQRGPFPTGALAERYALVPAQAEAVLRGLELEGRLLAGEFHPAGSGQEWCEPEVLRRLRRHTLAKLRDEVAPVDAPVVARFLSGWHGIGGEGGLDEKQRFSSIHSSEDVLDERREQWIWGCKTRLPW